jgi:hypothetical protein
MHACMPACALCRNARTGPIRLADLSTASCRGPTGLRGHGRKHPLGLHALPTCTLQLGIGSTEKVNKPTRVIFVGGDQPTGCASVSASATHTCFLDTRNGVYCTNKDTAGEISF